MRRWYRGGMTAVVVVLGLAATAGLAACGSSSDSGGSGSSPSTPDAPEDLRTSDAAVAAGLKDITSIATRTANAVEAGDEAAKTLDEGIEPAWQPIEGTIKANDADIYIAFEDNFAVLADAVSSSDAVQAKNAANTIKSTADDYLADYPG